jgi:hypothetical protein
MKKYEESPSVATTAVSNPPSLVALARDQAPSRDLWPQIAARIAATVSEAEITLPEETVSCLAALARNHAPSTDLWPGIARRIEVRQRHRRRAPWLAAASIAASLVVVLGLLVARDPALHHAPLRAPAELLAGDEMRNPALLQTANRPLRSETRALVRANLKIVNGAEAQLQRALEADPNAAYLHSLLETTRQQQRELRGALRTEVASAEEH